MTFTPSVLSKTDTNNSISTTTSSFIGTSAPTTGYTSIQVSLHCSVSSTPLGLKIRFSPDGITFTTKMSDTIVADTNYFKTFSVFDKFYKIELSLVSSGLIQLETRLCTNTPEDQESYYEKSENSMYDAFTKLRVSNPFSLMEIKFPSQSVGRNTRISFQ